MVSQLQAIYEKRDQTISITKIPQPKTLSKCLRLDK